jgi:nucleotide-binding universal stress UspA family protein
MQTPEGAPVVVGVNGSAAGLAAVRMAAREAVARDRELRVVHAFTWPGGDGAEQEYAPARHAAAQIVAEAVTTAQRSTPGVRVSGAVHDGPATRVLLHQSRGAELLILGDDDLATIPRLPIDSVLVQTVARAWCPVAVARGLRPPRGSLIAAVDGSPTALEALRHAAAEAARREIVLEVVHVVADRDGAAERAGQEVLAAAVAAIPEVTRVRSRLLTGDPAATLLRLSRHARLVAMGPRGLDGGTLLGQVAQEVLRRCACPTVFVHGTTAGVRCTPGTVPSAGALAT